ncbi:MAG: twin-arginine translocase TatA/TatE family subunit [Muribaculaceae bacterium]
MMASILLFIGTTELLLIGGLALLLFGGKKLPEMMRGLGQGVKEFKKGVNEVKDVVQDEDLNDSNSEADNSADKDSLTCDQKQGNTNVQK